MKETKVSRTDPDAGSLVREGKPTGFFYLDHRTVGGRLAIITDTHVTPASVHARSSIWSGSIVSGRALASTCGRGA
ncbi:hypothetical protein GCM10023174_20240 [Chelativorans composti]